MSIYIILIMDKSDFFKKIKANKNIFFFLFIYIFRKNIMRFIYFIRYYKFFASCKSYFTKISMKIPYVYNIVQKSIDDTVNEIKKDFNKLDDSIVVYNKLPKKGLKTNDIINNIKTLRKYETKNIDHSKISGTVYANDEDHLNLISNIFLIFFKTNPLHPDVFPNLRRIEASIVKMCIPLFSGDNKTVGCVTSGGTESIMLACLSYRELGRKKGIYNPEIIAPVTVHTAFDKACYYFNIKLIKVPVDKDDNINIGFLESYINRNTVCLVGSAPGFPHGIMDPIEELSKIAKKNNIGLHVDSCLGGFLLPFLEDKINFDFKCCGVTSISADLHKYGYCPKGVSLLLYKNKELMHNQYFVETEWPGGIYATSTMLGSRSGNLLSLTYATLLHYGEKDYEVKTKEIVDTTKYLVEEIKTINDISVVGKPDLNVIGIKSNNLDIYVVSDKMKKLGWNLNNLQYPSSIHLCVTSFHVSNDMRNKFIQDLKTSVYEARNSDKNGESASIYGSSQKVSNRSIVKEITHGYLDCIYS